MVSYVLPGLQAWEWGDNVLEERRCQSKIISTFSIEIQAQLLKGSGVNLDLIEKTALGKQGITRSIEIAIQLHPVEVSHDPAALKSIN